MNGTAHLPKALQNLSLPVIGSPMFIASGPRLVAAQCKAGIVGAFPALNARPAELLDTWLTDLQTELAAYQAANAVYARDGVKLAGEALQPTSSATTVRVRGGKTQTMDGPFAETKEQLGGFYMFDCASLDDAIRYAAMIPSAAHGSVEVRPIMDLS